METKRRWIVALGLLAGLWVAACSTASDESGIPNQAATGRGLALPVGDEPTERPEGKDAPPELGRFEAIVWRDGDRRRTAWLDRSALVEFGPSPVGHDELSGRFLQETRSDPAVRLWAVPDSAHSRDVCDALDAVRPSVHVSPVFRPSQGSAASAMGLPGGVILHLESDWSEARVEAWLAGRGLAIARRLELVPNAFLIDSAPGLTALELANELADAPGVRIASPNWWRELDR